MEPSKFPARAYLLALGQLHTYALPKNGFAFFGLLASLLPSILLVASGGRAGLPFALLNSLLWTIAFGAIGTLRRGRDREAAGHVDHREAKIKDLMASNERNKELDLLKARFVTDLAPSLTTPLLAIRDCNASLLSGRFGPTTRDQRDSLALAARDIGRVQKVILDLLEFERIERGDCLLDMTDFHLESLIHETLENLGPLTGDSPMRVRLRIPKGLKVRADRDRIGCVLLNLVSNGFRYSAGDAMLDIGAKESGTDGRIHVIVRAHGPGIPITAQKYLFSRFWQAEGSSRRTHGVAGLGLAIVKGILDAHGSSIGVASDGSSGTQVSFDLPISPLEDPAPGSGMARGDEGWTRETSGKSQTAGSAGER